MATNKKAAPMTEPQEGLLAWIYESECDEYNEELYPYALAQQNGEAVAALFPALTAHLALCPQCRALYQELQHLVESETRANLTTGTAFNQAPTPEQPPTAPATLRHTLAQGVDWVMEQSQTVVQLWVHGAELLAQLTAGTPQPLAVRGTGSAAQPEWWISTSSIQQTLPSHAAAEIRMALITDPGDAQHVTWQVEVTQPARWPDFSGVTVTLYPAAGQPQSRVTGENGIVQFTGLARQAVGAIQVAIELPLA